MQPGSPRNQQTNVPHLFAIGEADYQYHGANRLGANSLLSCIFAGLFVAPGIYNLLQSQSKAAAIDLPASLFQGARSQHQAAQEEIIRRPAGGENPYVLHQELGDLMTRVATVVRRNDQLSEAIENLNELQERVQRCSLSDTGNWTNQNLIFTSALEEMMPLAKCILQGALQRDECRGAHYKPEFAHPNLTAPSPEERLREAEKWCDDFEANNQKWLHAECDDTGARYCPNGHHG